MLESVAIFRASSTWQLNTKKFGPLNALDNKTEDAWKSAASENNNPLQYYEVHFKRDVKVHEIKVQFQGGFVGMDCIVFQKSSDNDDWEEFEELYMETIESNEVQCFGVEFSPDQSDVEPCRSIRIEFGKSSDFYGRIVIYSLEIWGIEE